MYRLEWMRASDVKVNDIYLFDKNAIGLKARCVTSKNFIAHAKLLDFVFTI